MSDKQKMVTCQTEMEARLLPALDGAMGKLAAKEAECEALRVELAEAKSDIDKLHATFAKPMAILLDRQAAADAKLKRMEPLVERAFRDGVAYATNVDVTDVDLAWETSQARAALASGQEGG